MSATSTDIVSLLLPLLESAGNRVLEVDPETRDRIALLQGRSIALHVRHIDRTLLLTPLAEGLQFSAGGEGPADVTLSAAPSVLARIAANGLDEGAYAPGELEIHGDAMLAQQFARILAGLDVDWEELIARQTGDVPARFISRNAGEFLAWSRETAQVLQQNVVEYLVEEARMAASRVEVDAFLHDVDELRADTERLAAHIERLPVDGRHSTSE